MLPAIAAAGGVLTAGVMAAGVAAGDKDESGESPTDSDIPPAYLKGGSPETEREESQQSGSGKAVGGMAAGTGAAAEATRRAGIDRHAESGLAENLHAYEYARQTGGSVIEDGSSVFTPDGGIDKVVVTDSGEKAIQSKHFADEVGNSILADYAGEIDVFASSNGTKDGVDAAAYGMEEFTYSEWSWQAKAKLEWYRIKQGLQSGLKWLKGSTSNGVGQVVSAAKSAAQGLKSIARYFAGAAKSAGSWFVGLSLGKQILFIAVAVGTSYVVWRWWRSDEGLELEARFGELV